MEWLDALMGRRSIRQYTAEPVGEPDIEAMLRAAMAAPSAGNQQPWRFIAVTDAETRAALAESTPYASPAGRAPLVVAVCGDTRAERHPGYWVQDCSAAMQNLLVAAHALGLGAVWIGVHPIAEREGAVRDILALPAGVVCLGLVAVGHPAESKPPSERFEPTYVHRDRWSDMA